MKEMTFTVNETDFILTDEMSEAEKDYIFQQAMKEKAKSDSNVIDLMTEVKRILIKSKKAQQEIVKLKREIHVMDMEIIAYEHLIAKRDQAVMELKKLEEQEKVYNNKKLAEYEGKRALGEGLSNLP